MFQFISVFFALFSSSFSFNKRIAIILVFVFVLVMKIALADSSSTEQNSPRHPRRREGVDWGGHIHITFTRWRSWIDADPV